MVDLTSLLVPGHGPEHITGMSPALQASLMAMIAEAPPEVQAGLRILSGYRSPERQAQLYNAALAKYGSPAAARRWVAPPGGSQHGRGNAADLQYVSDIARQYAHENAGRYDLAFPLAHEPWHIEVAGARNGGVGPTRAAAAGLDPSNPLNMVPGGGQLPAPAAPPPPNPISAALEAMTANTGGVGGGGAALGGPTGPAVSRVQGPFAAGTEADASKAQTGQLSRDFLQTLPEITSTTPAPRPDDLLQLMPETLRDRPVGPFWQPMAQKRGRPSPTAPLGPGMRLRS